jgi:hypothetical protein
MILKRWIAVLMAAAVFFLAGCSIFISEEDKGNIEVVPQIADVKSEEVTATLYFPYDDPSGMLFLLSGDTRKISIAPNERLEAAVLREMISGPSDTQSSLKAVLNPNTSVVSIQVNGEYLFVTLSREFLQPNGIEDGWEQNETLTKQRNDLQKLATYSVVNTLLLLGQDYSRVQIMVDKTGSGSGERLTYAELGFTGEGNDNKVAEPLGRFEDVTLDPEKTAQLVFNFIVGKNWSKAYEFVASRTQSGGTRPALEDMMEELSVASFILENFEILDQTISVDGKTATVFVNYTTRTSGGISNTVSNRPIRLVQENELWKMNYASFQSLFAGKE